MVRDVVLLGVEDAYRPSSLARERSERLDGRRGRQTSILNPSQADKLMGLAQDVKLFFGPSLDAAFARLVVAEHAKHGVCGRRRFVQPDGSLVIPPVLKSGDGVSRRRASSVRRVTRKTQANLTRCWIEDPSGRWSSWFLLVWRGVVAAR